MTDQTTSQSTSKSPDTVKARPVQQSGNGMQDARPLLQAIFLGILLAAILTAAAAVAGPERDLKELLKTGLYTINYPFSDKSGI